MSNQMNRRGFLQSTAAAAATGYFVGSAPANRPPGPNEQIRLAIVGVNGRGGGNLNGVAHEGIVALCDVDENRAADARRRFPRAEYHADFRRMLDRQRNIDAVVISTPDHTHAVVGMAALRAGKHVYCEKPLTHSVHEARQMIETARRQRAKTQMGTQIHAGNNYRRVVELVQAGAIGAIRRVKVWCSRRPDSGRRALERTQPPNGLNYDLWLGPAPYRNYHASHGHFNWRWWWDFGGGVLADMGCHFMDLAHWSLDLSTPTTIQANGRKTHKGDNNVPTVLQVDYNYPARGNKPPVHLTWYHGVSGPNLNNRVRFAGYSSGVLFEGERGQLISNYNQHALLPAERFRDFQRPRQTIAASIGHHREWLDAIRNNRTTTCNFDYSGPLAVSVLLGNVAYRAGERLVWDDRAGRITNTRRGDEFLQREYRRGWRL